MHVFLPFVQKNLDFLHKKPRFMPKIPTTCLNLTLAFSKGEWNYFTSQVSAVCSTMSRSEVKFLRLRTSAT